MQITGILKLIGLSFLLGIPLSLYFMNKWLNDYAFRVNISVLDYLIAGVCILGISIVSVSYKAYITAIKNPVEAIKID